MRDLYRLSGSNGKRVFILRPNQEKNTKSRKNKMLRCVSASKLCLSHEEDTVQQCWDNLPCEWLLIKMSKRPAPVTTDISQYYRR